MSLFICFSICETYYPLPAFDLQRRLGEVLRQWIQAGRITCSQNQTLHTVIPSALAHRWKEEYPDSNTNLPYYFRSPLRHASAPASARVSSV